jgi:hypothetical protein
MIDLFNWQEPQCDRITDSLIKDNCFLDCSSTGAGKTYLALEAARRLKLRPFVVAPLYALPTWEKTAQLFGMDIDMVHYEALLSAVTQSKVIDGQRRRVVIPEAKLSPERLASLHGWWTHAKRDWKWSPDISRAGRILIFDEAHKLTAVDSQLSRLLIAAKDQEITTLMLSATPYYSPLKMRAMAWMFDLLPNKLSATFQGWCLQYGCHLANYGQPEWSGDPKSWEWLRKAVGTRMGGINVNDIPGFPENQYVVKMVPTSTNPDGLYDKALQLLREEAPTAAVEAIRARQEAEWGKRESILAMAKDLVLQGYSVPIFVSFIETGRWLAKALKAPFIQGETPQGDRNTFIEQFQENAKGFHSMVLSMGAGSTSISLHDLNERSRASIICPGVNSIDFVQACGRSWRAGALSKTIQYIVFAEDSNAETQVAGNLQKKLKALQTLTDHDLDMFS